MTVTRMQDGSVAILTIENPPVNALGRAVRAALADHARAIAADPACTAVVLQALGRTFVGGADITEFDRPVEDPDLPGVLRLIAASAKPWVALVQGAALGGGCELALACHYRLAGPQARFALPEVSLGLIPGAGGTQRLPRLIGLPTAVAMVVQGRGLGPAEALVAGLVDRCLEGDLLPQAIRFAREVAKAPLPVTPGQRPTGSVDPDFWTQAASRADRIAKGAQAPGLALEVMRHGAEQGFAAGLGRERETFLRLRQSDEAAALRYLFFAERALLQPADLRDVPARDLEVAGVVGGGTMGVGIAAALAMAGKSVILAERDQGALDRAMTGLAAILQGAVRRGTLTEAQVRARLEAVRPTTDLRGLAPCDLVIEAVFEDLAVKRALFADLSAICRPDAILATNTSYLDPSAIAKDLPHPQRFLGLHFFSPAQVMKLVEVIPTPDTAKPVLATIYALARALGKMPVRSGICDGFIGNRILRAYRGRAEVLVLSGVPYPDIDAAMRQYGMAMGPFEMQDLAGLDIAFMRREAARAGGAVVPDEPGDWLVRAGRKGQKSGAGWYDYVTGDRTPIPSPEVARILADRSGPARTVGLEDIAQALVSAMATEGQAILDEGIAAQASDIDLVKVHGYGFPRWRGGPMFAQSRRKEG